MVKSSKILLKNNNGPKTLLCGTARTPLININIINFLILNKYLKYEDADFQILFRSFNKSIAALFIFNKTIIPNLVDK